ARGEAVDWRVTDRQVAGGGESVRFDLVDGGGRRLPVESPIPGEVNVANTALAGVMLLEAGVGESAAANGGGRRRGDAGRMVRRHPRTRTSLSSRTTIRDRRSRPRSGRP